MRFMTIAHFSLAAPRCAAMALGFASIFGLSPLSLGPAPAQQSLLPPPMSQSATPPAEAARRQPPPASASETGDAAADIRTITATPSTPKPLPARKPSTPKRGGGDQTPTDRPSETNAASAQWNIETVAALPRLPLLVDLKPPLPLDVEGETSDFAFGAYQRGWYLTALGLASDRAQTGDAAAQTLLGRLYENGLGIPRDTARAADWYEIAANNGATRAAHALARLLLAGDGRARDPAQAADLLEAALTAQTHGAALDLARLYLSGEGRPQDLERARDLLKQAAEAENIEAQYELANLLLDETSSVRDDTLGALWMRRAAANRFTPAALRYGILRFQGRGVDVDEAEAAGWFAAAADAGNPVAMNRLARVYAAGRGRERDPIEAAAWHILAKALGVVDPNLDSLMETLTPEERRAAANLAASRAGVLPVATEIADPERIP